MDIPGMTLALQVIGAMALIVLMVVLSILAARLLQQMRDPAQHIIEHHIYRHSNGQQKAATVDETVPATMVDPDKPADPGPPVSTIKERIVHFLEQVHDVQEVNKIAEEIQAKATSVRVELHQNKDIFFQLNNKWGLSVWVRTEKEGGTK